MREILRLNYWIHFSEVLTNHKHVNHKEKRQVNRNYHSGGKRHCQSISHLMGKWQFREENYNLVNFPEYQVFVFYISSL